MDVLSIVTAAGVYAKTLGERPHLLQRLISHWQVHATGKLMATPRTIALQQL
jgi:hypothetical protein